MHILIRHLVLSFLSFSPAAALSYAFKRLDADISLEAQAPFSNDLEKTAAIQVRRQAFCVSLALYKHTVFKHVYHFFAQTAFAGCTACVAHVGPDGIHVANVGDCRAVLGVQEVDGSLGALPLSWDHNSDNEAEVERIRALHPSSEQDTVVTDGRLLGVSTLHNNNPRVAP